LSQSIDNLIEKVEEALDEYSIAAEKSKNTELIRWIEQAEADLDYIYMYNERISVQGLATLPYGDTNATLIHREGIDLKGVYTRLATSLMFKLTRASKLNNPMTASREKLRRIQTERETPKAAGLVKAPLNLDSPFGPIGSSAKKQFTSRPQIQPISRSSSTQK